jgi:hypothetical protein
MTSPRNSAVSLVLAGLFTLASAPDGPRAQTEARPPTARVTYVASEGVYVTAGRSSGLAVGDTLVVLRDGREISRVVVTELSSHSAACMVVEGLPAVRVGDAVDLGGGTGEAAVRSDRPTPEPPAATRRTRWRREDRRNEVRGTLVLQNLWLRDLTGSGLTTAQPSLGARIAVENLAGTGAELRIRHRTRLYHRTADDGSRGRDDWVHRLSELALVYGDRNAPVQTAVGRVLSPEFRGVGYVDGGYMSVRVHPDYRVGVAGGVEPRYPSTAVNAERWKLGGFVRREVGTYEGERWVSMVSVAGSYEQGLISREFLHLQNLYSRGRVFSLRQSLEVDVNRHWRIKMNDDRLVLSNLFVSARVEPAAYVSVDLSYDSRRRVRDQTTFDTPDSLFDESRHSGLRGGFVVRLPWSLSLRASGALREREGGERSAKFGSVSVRAADFPRPRDAVTAAVSISDTDFTTAYRPLLSYSTRAPGGVRLGLSGGAYLYDTLGLTSQSGFVEIEMGGVFLRRAFTSLRLRRSFGDTIESLQLVTELGVSL